MKAKLPVVFAALAVLGCGALASALPACSADLRKANSCDAVLLAICAKRVECGSPVSKSDCFAQEIATVSDSRHDKCLSDSADQAQCLLDIEALPCEPTLQRVCSVPVYTQSPPDGGTVFPSGPDGGSVADAALPTGPAKPLATFTTPVVAAVALGSGLAVLDQSNVVWQVSSSGSKGSMGTATGFDNSVQRLAVRAGKVLYVAGNTIRATDGSTVATFPAGTSLSAFGVVGDGLFARSTTGALYRLDGAAPSMIVPSNVITMGTTESAVYYATGTMAGPVTYFQTSPSSGTGTVVYSGVGTPTEIYGSIARTDGSFLFLQEKGKSVALGSSSVAAEAQGKLIVAILGAKTTVNLIDSRGLSAMRVLGESEGAVVVVGYSTSLGPYWITQQGSTSTIYTTGSTSLATGPQ